MSQIHYERDTLDTEEQGQLLAIERRIQEAQRLQSSEQSEGFKKSKKKANIKSESKFYNTVIKPAFEWFTNTHISGLGSTYSLYPRLSDLSVERFAGSLRNLFQKAFPFDGLDVSTGQITAADGSQAPVYSSIVPWSVWILSFLGFPSRPETITDRIVKLSFLQFLRNLIGGWNPVKESLTGDVVNGSKNSVEANVDDEVHSLLASEATKTFSQRRWNEKKIIAALVLSLKLFIILPIKLITFPFKFLLNVLKLVTEVLLPFVSFVAAILGAFFIRAVVNSALRLVGYKPARGLHSARFSFGLFNLLRLIPLIIFTPFAIAFYAAQYAMLWASRIALAFTSPEKSARLAFDAGRKFLIGTHGSKFQIAVSYIMGGLGAIISLAISAFSWMLALPLAFSSLVTVFPSLITAFNWVANLPFVTSALAWLGQWPVVTSSAALVNSFFGIVGGALASVFGPAVTWMAAVISVQVPAATLYVGMTLGLIFMPVAAAVSRGLDELSNAWARWVEQAPFAAIKAGIKARWNRSKEKSVEAVPLLTSEQEQDLNILESSSMSKISEVSKAQLEEVQAQQQADLYVIQPVPGEIYIASNTPLHLVMKMSEAGLEANKAVDCIVVRGREAAQLRDRATNVAAKGLLTQGVRFASKAEMNSTRENPIEPEGIFEKPKKSALKLKLVNPLQVPVQGDGISGVYRPQAKV